MPRRPASRQDVPASNPQNPEPVPDEPRPRLPGIRKAKPKSIEALEAEADRACSITWALLRAYRKVPTDDAGSTRGRLFAALDNYQAALGRLVDAELGPD